MTVVGCFLLSDMLFFFRLYMVMDHWQVTIYLTQEQSRHARDALAKAVYAAMFEWIVERTNECIEAKQQGEVMSEDRIFIGLLDIFGEHLRVTLFVWNIY